MKSQGLNCNNRETFTSWCCRFEKMANEILAETTIAGQEGVITYLANSAALQQFEQTALAYLALTSSDRPLDEEGLCNYIEELLNKEFQVQVFAANLVA